MGRGSRLLDVRLGGGPEEEEEEVRLNNLGMDFFVFGIVFVCIFSCFVGAHYSVWSDRGLLMIFSVFAAIIVGEEDGLPLDSALNDFVVVVFILATAILAFKHPMFSTILTGGLAGALLCTLVMDGLFFMEIMNMTIFGISMAVSVLLWGFMTMRSASPPDLTPDPDTDPYVPPAYILRLNHALLGVLSPWYLVEVCNSGHLYIAVLEYGCRWDIMILLI
eukprot:gene5257-6391_t